MSTQARLYLNTTDVAAFMVQGSQRVMESTDGVPATMEFTLREVYRPAGGGVADLTDILPDGPQGDMNVFYGEYNPVSHEWEEVYFPGIITTVEIDENSAGRIWVIQATADLDVLNTPIGYVYFEAGVMTYDGAAGTQSFDCSTDTGRIRYLIYRYLYGPPNFEWYYSGVYYPTSYITYTTPGGYYQQSIRDILQDIAADPGSDPDAPVIPRGWNVWADSYDGGGRYLRYFSRVDGFALASQAITASLPTAGQVLAHTAKRTIDWTRVVNALVIQGKGGDPETVAWDDGTKVHVDVQGAEVTKNHQTALYDAGVWSAMQLADEGGYLEFQPRGPVGIAGDITWDDPTKVNVSIASAVITKVGGIDGEWDAGAQDLTDITTAGGTLEGTWTEGTSGSEGASWNPAYNLNVTITGAQVTKSGGTDHVYDAYALSAQTFVETDEAGCYIEVQLPASKEVQVGFARLVAGTPTWVLYLKGDGAHARVWFGGAEHGSIAYSGSDTLRLYIKMVDGTPAVEVTKAGTLVYSATPPVGQVAFPLVGRVGIASASASVTPTFYLTWPPGRAIRPTWDPAYTQNLRVQDNRVQKISGTDGSFDARSLSVEQFLDTDTTGCFLEAPFAANTALQLGFAHLVSGAPAFVVSVRSDLTNHFTVNYLGSDHGSFAYAANDTIRITLKYSGSDVVLEVTKNGTSAYTDTPTAGTFVFPFYARVAVATMLGALTPVLHTIVPNRRSERVAFGFAETYSVGSGLAGLRLGVRTDGLGHLVVLRDGVALTAFAYDTGDAVRVTVTRLSGLDHWEVLHGPVGASTWLTRYSETLPAGYLTYPLTPVGLLATRRSTLSVQLTAVPGTGREMAMGWAVTPTGTDPDSLVLGLRSTSSTTMQVLHEGTVLAAFAYQDGDKHRLDVRPAAPADAGFTYTVEYSVAHEDTPTIWIVRYSAIRSDLTTWPLYVGTMIQTFNAAVHGAIHRRHAYSRFLAKDLIPDYPYPTKLKWAAQVLKDDTLDSLAKRTARALGVFGILAYPRDSYTPATWGETSTGAHYQFHAGHAADVHDVRRYGASVPRLVVQRVTRAWEAGGRWPEQQIEAGDRLIEEGEPMPYLTRGTRDESPVPGRPDQLQVIDQVLNAGGKVDVTIGWSADDPVIQWVIVHVTADAPDPAQPFSDLLRVRFSARVTQGTLPNLDPDQALRLTRQVQTQDGALSPESYATRAHTRTKVPPQPAGVQVNGSSPIDQETATVTVEVRPAPDVGAPDTYRVEAYSVAAIRPVATLTIPGGTTLATLRGLTQGVTYFFDAVALEGTNESPPSPGQLYRVPIFRSIPPTPVGGVGGMDTELPGWADWGNGQIETDLVPLGGQASYRLGPGPPMVTGAIALWEGQLFTPTITFQTVPGATFTVTVDYWDEAGETTGSDPVITAGVSDSAWSAPVSKPLIAPTGTRSATLTATSTDDVCYWAPLDWDAATGNAINLESNPEQMWRNAGYIGVRRYVARLGGDTKDNLDITSQNPSNDVRLRLIGELLSSRIELDADGVRIKSAAQVLIESDSDDVTVGAAGFFSVSTADINMTAANSVTLASSISGDIALITSGGTIILSSSTGVINVPIRSIDPVSPNDGDVWFLSGITFKELKAHIGGVTYILGSTLFGTGTVTAVTASSPLASSGGATPDISVANQAANKVLASPTSGGSGAVTARSLVAADLPALWPTSAQSVNFTAAVDTVYFLSGAHTVTLPSAAASAGHAVLLIVVGGFAWTMARGGADTIEGATSRSTAANGAFWLVPQGTDWRFIQTLTLDTSVVALAPGGSGGTNLTASRSDHAHPMPGFIDLPDTLGSYGGLGGQLLRVNAGESGLEAFTLTSGDPAPQFHDADFAVSNTDPSNVSHRCDTTLMVTTMQVDLPSLTDVYDGWKVGFYFVDGSNTIDINGHHGDPIHVLGGDVTTYNLAAPGNRIIVEASLNTINLVWLVHTLV